jgi:hypothetical protein
VRIIWWHKQNFGLVSSVYYSCSEGIVILLWKQATCRGGIALKYDKPLIAFVIGAAATISGELLTRALLSMGIGKYSLYELISFYITINRPSEITGLFLGCMLGGLVAVLFYYALAKIGLDYLVVKGVIFSILSYFIAEMVFTSDIEGHFIDIRPIADYYVHASAGIIYGITMGLLFKTYLFNSSTFSKHK